MRRGGGPKPMEVRCARHGFQETEMSKFVKGVALLIVVAGVVRLVPDFVRYMKIRAM